MHCSDEDLVAYLDGELPRLRRRRTERHLQSCWQCRTQLAAIEQQIQQLTKEIEDWSFPGPAWIVEGKRRLNSRIREFEARTASAQTIRPKQRRAAQWLWPAAAAATIAGVIIAVWPVSRTKKTSVTASAAITRAVAVEKDLYTKPLQQIFEVEIEELRPARKVRSGRLEVWTDHSKGRFASRWIVENGVLKHAIWKPGPGTSDFLYSPAVSKVPVPWTSPSDQPLPLGSLAEYGLDPAQVERAFLRWLESGAGRAISFTSDLAVWSHQDGTILKAERIRQENGPPEIRVTAQRTTRRLTAVLRIDFDSASYRPRLQTLRFETPEHAIEFRLAAKQMRLISSTELKANLFSPEKRLFLDPAVPILPPAPKESAGSVDLPKTPAGLSSDGAFDALEAHYVLHQAGACLGEPVKIEEQRDGVRVQSLGQGPWRESFTSTAGIRAVLSAFAELRDAPPPMSDLNEGSDAGFDTTKALRHAWALARLARRFPASTTENMPPESWRLLEIMVRDHVTSIDVDLQPLHPSLQLPEATEERIATSRGWRYSSSLVLETLTRALALLRDEPLAKVVPLLQEVVAELRILSEEFSAEHLRSQPAFARHAR
jgi:Predicted transmembrane transcriptional regulator (anti-sigma factor)